MEFCSRLPQPVPASTLLVPKNLALLFEPPTHSVPVPVMFPATASTFELDSAVPTVSVSPVGTFKSPATTVVPAMLMPEGEPSELSPLLYSL